MSGNAKHRLMAYCNSGEQKYNIIARLTVFPMHVHFKRDTMASIVNMKIITEIEGGCITMETARDTNSIVTLTDGCTYTFKPYANRLYYFDTNTIKSIIKSKDEVTNYSLLQAVKNNEIYFTM